MQKCTIVLTDSGGIQEEAPGLGKPVLVMRNTTERQEAIEAGTVKLTGTDKQTIINEVNHLLTDHQYYLKMAEAVNPYGDGKLLRKYQKCFKANYEITSLKYIETPQLLLFKI